LGRALPNRHPLHGARGVSAGPADADGLPVGWLCSSQQDPRPGVPKIPPLGRRTCQPRRSRRTGTCLLQKICGGTTTYTRQIARDLREFTEVGVSPAATALVFFPSSRALETRYVDAS
jgi:hypothetical protein